VIKLLLSIIHAYHENYIFYLMHISHVLSVNFKINRNMVLFNPTVNWLITMFDYIDKNIIDLNIMLTLLSKVEIFTW